MRDSASARQTFLLDPGRGHQFTRADLLGRRGYYATRDFENVLMWGAEGVIDPGGAARWAGCGPPSAPGATEAGDCPADRQQPAHLSPMRNALANTTIHALHAGDAFIALVCGNFSKATAQPMPSITGVKFEDVNGNGQRDGGESLLSGWTIQL